MKRYQIQLWYLEDPECLITKSKTVGYFPIGLFHVIRIILGYFWDKQEDDYSLSYSKNKGHKVIFLSKERFI